LKTEGHWQEIAGKWAQVGPPLRPSAQDIEGFQKLIRGTRALILGCTPELYRLAWPDGTDLLAMDHTRNMIDTVWPGPRDAILCADWTAMPLQPGSRDIVLCDGGFHLMSHPEGQQRFVRSLKSVLAPGGVYGVRLFVPPAVKESKEYVLQDLLDQRVPNLNILKLRLGMAIQESPSQGVRLGDVWSALHQAAPDFEKLAESIGWPIEHLKAIDTYKNSDARYCFVTPEEVEALFSDGFMLESKQVPTYELGERCPILAFRRV
jgi:SAM-dependent methyltransferase